MPRLALGQNVEPRPLGVADRHAVDHLAYAAGVMNLVINMAVSGKYSCLVT